MLPSGQLEVDVKKRLHHDVSTWAVEGKAPEPPPGRAAFVLRTQSEGATQRMVLTMPAKSRAVGNPRRVAAELEAAARVLDPRHRVHELAERSRQLIEVDQERIVAVR